ncbi:MAG: hypothetical protein ACREKH_19390 [Candidatus Rokuibacteriota bacterium]
MTRQTEGRCPDCGAPVLVTITRGRPAEIPPHACGARACEYEGCPVRALMDEMVQFPAGEWYCPNHGLLLAARDLVSLYRVEGDADWTAICEIITELLPELVAKAEARERSRPSSRS